MFQSIDNFMGATVALRAGAQQTVQTVQSGLASAVTAPVNSLIQKVGTSVPLASGLVGGALNRTALNFGIPGNAGAAAGPVPSSVGAAPDLRVRLRALPGRDADVYGNGILAILRETNGMLFPYTPTITYTQDVEYSTVDMVHYIGDVNAYKRTPSVTLTVSGKFTAQNQSEAQYLATCLHFLRTVSKMHFGANDSKAGLPPPVLMFEGYGNLMFGLQNSGVRVVVKSHSYTLDDTVDSVVVTLPGGHVARVPMLTTINVTITTQNTPAQMRKFDLEAFRSGALLARGGYL